MEPEPKMETGPPALIESIVRLCSLSCRISYGLRPLLVPIFEMPFNNTSRSALGYGSGFHSTPWSTVKVVTDVPIPSPSVRTTTKTKPGVRLSDRRASFSILFALTARAPRGLAQEEVTGGNNRR